MTRPHRFLVSVVTTLALGTTAARAEAYCRTTTCNAKTENCRIVDGCPRSGTPIVWPSLPIPFRFHGRPPEHLDRDEARGSIRLAFARWTEVVCPGGRRTSLRFEEGPEMPAAQARGKEPFGIYFRDDGWPHDDVNETLALTTQLFRDRSGEVQYSDIEVNSGQHQFALRDTDKGKDLEAIITHEVGHYIGLAHSPERDSIMTPQYCQDEKRCSTTKELARDLGEDDIAAVCALYPPAGTYAPEPEQAGCAVTPAGSSRAPVFPIILGVLALLAARPRRRP
jgi:MYXO-CTERM domain-containing protein